MVGHHRSRCGNQFLYLLHPSSEIGCNDVEWMHIADILRATIQQTQDVETMLA